MAEDEDVEGTPTPATRTRRIGKMNTLGQVSEELTRLYRCFWKGQITSAEASRMASVLQVKRQCLADTAVEERLNKIEASLEAVSSDTVVQPLRRAA